MDTCLRHIETIIHDQFFFINFAFHQRNEEGLVAKGKTYPIIHSPVHGDTMAKIVAL